MLVVGNFIVIVCLVACRDLIIAADVKGVNGRKVVGIKQLVGQGFLLTPSSRSGVYRASDPTRDCDPHHLDASCLARPFPWDAIHYSRDHSSSKTQWNYVTVLNSYS